MPGGESQVQQQPRQHGGSPLPQACLAGPDRQSRQLLPQQQTDTAQGGNKGCLFLPPHTCFWNKTRPARHSHPVASTSRLMDPRPSGPEFGQKPRADLSVDEGSGF